MRFSFVMHGRNVFMKPTGIEGDGPADGATAESKLYLASVGRSHALLTASL